jgi:methanethiol S-methyltransferase
VKTVTRAIDYSMLTLAIVLGGGSIVLFAWENRPVFTTRVWSPGIALAFDAFLSFVFFVQHSGMVRRSFRSRLAAVVPARYDGAVYSIGSGIALTVAVVFWQPTSAPLFALTGLPRAILTACSLSAIGLFAISIYTLRTFDPFGTRPIRAHLRGEAAPTVPFVVAGPYRWVRHPLYSCILVLLWAKPSMRADQLLMAGLWTAWILVGAVLEERDLVAEFEEKYRRYQRYVPMLVPWRGPVTVPAEAPAGLARG